MTTINRLSSVDALQPGDLIPVWDTSNGDPRKASMTTLLAFIDANFADPDAVTRIVAPTVDGYSIDIGATGTSTWLIVNPTVDATTASITLPPATSAVNDQRISVVFTAPVTTFSVTSAGATVLGAPVAVASYDTFVLQYNTSQLTWYTIAEGNATSADQVTYTPAGTGAVATTVRDKLRDYKSVKDFGASSSATAAENLLAFNAAVTATPTGGTLIIPVDSSFYLIDTTGGRSAAVMVNKSMHIVFEGDVKASFGDIQANPPTIFNVSADNVTFSGTGSIIGDGTVNSVNTGTDATIPTLVYVTGDDFHMTGVLIDTPHKVGVHIVGCFRAVITGNRFTGGPTAYSDTAHFGIRCFSSGGHIIANNQFYPDAAGGMYVQCIFFSSTSNSVIEGNIATRPYEKLVYNSGSYNVITGNFVLGNPGTVPGTNAVGTIGAVYRCDGAYNKVTNNYSLYGGGVAVRYGAGNDVSGNQIMEAGQSGIVVFEGLGAFDYTTIRNNTIVNGNLSGVTLGAGISIAPGVATNKYLDISHNIIKGYSVTDPIVNVATWTGATVYPTVSLTKPTVSNSRYYSTTTGGTSGATEPVWPTTPGATIVDGTITWTALAFDGAAAIQLNGGFAYSLINISHNIIDDAVTGIATTDVNTSTISFNIINAGTTGIIETTGSANKYEFNYVIAPTLLSGLAANSYDVQYAQGEWTPVISDGTNNATMGGSGSNAGSYTRIGRMVTLTANVATSALGSVTGDIRITGLPFAVGTGTLYNTVATIAGAGGLALPVAGQNVGAILISGTQYLQLRVWDSTLGDTAMQATEWTDDGAVTLSVVYHV